tara:strand:+ start:1 stop:1350 length:1350 start_codon:yes stop_codon:yes gene_type:complete
MWSANLFVLFCLALIVSPYGNIRLGGKEARPTHSRISWLAMLFAAGMGIGLMFWGVAEPVAYFTGWYETPLGVEANTPEAAKLAMGATMFHWGLHPWAIYAVVSLSLAFFCYNKGLPLSIRSIFYPILGDKAWGWPGHLIDILAVLATLFGLATSLGLGAQQAAAGINHVFGTDGGIGLQIGVIVGVTLLAVISVVRGIDGGVKLLSNVNMIIAFVLLVFVALVGFSAAFGNLSNTVMGYVENIIPLSNPHGREDETWMHGWTVFYWAWWISWSPFVGMFIARVSEGRTIREFLIAVLLVPTVVTIFWMSIYGGIAIEQVVDKVGVLGEKGLTDVPLAMFQMFEALPMSQVLSFIAIVLVLVFFITSSDSGSLVIDSITAGGKVDAPVPQRIFWATIEGAIAAALVWIGGTQAIEALQAGAVSTGLPFTFVLLLMCVSLLLGLKTEPRN